MRRDIFDPEAHDVATTQLAVDSQVEHREVARPALDLELGPDRPHVLRAERRLRSDQLPLVPRYAARPPSDRTVLVLHSASPPLQRMSTMRHYAEAVGIPAAFGPIQSDHRRRCGPPQPLMTRCGHRRPHPPLDLNQIVVRRLCSIRRGPAQAIIQERTAS